MADDNDDQAEFWGGKAGADWVAQQEAMDRVLSPVLDGLLNCAELQRGHRVLDIGCGTGQSTLAAAALAGSDGQVLGVDISEPMLALARMRASAEPSVAFIRADAADHPFEANSFDRAISRFGVMFFAAPDAAFANIAHAMKPGGVLAFASWGQIDQNPFFTLPAAIAKAEIGAAPKVDPDAPGPFAFRDIAKVEEMLLQAGFTNVRGQAKQITLSLPGGAAALAALAVSIGPAARTLMHFASNEADVLRLKRKLVEGIAALPNAAIPAEINFFTAHHS